MATINLTEEGMERAETETIESESGAEIRALEAIDPPLHLDAPDLSENALQVLERRYLKKDDHGNVVETPAQCFWRVATHIAKAELQFPGGSPAVALSVAGSIPRTPV